jgi:hypothetical protein
VQPALLTCSLEVLALDGQPPACWLSRILCIQCGTSLASARPCAVFSVLLTLLKGSGIRGVQLMQAKLDLAPFCL